MRYKKITGAPERDIRAEKKKTKLKRLAAVAAVFIVVFGIFEAGIALEFKPIYPIYLVILTVLMILFLFFNKGFSTAVPSREVLPESWSDAEKDRFLEKLERDRAIGRKLLIFVIPFLLTFLIDFLILFLPELL